MSKGFIKRHLPPRIFTGADDEPETFNTAFIPKGKFPTENSTISISTDKNQNQVVCDPLNTISNENNAT